MHRKKVIDPREWKNNMNIYIYIIYGPREGRSPRKKKKKKQIDQPLDHMYIYIHIFTFFLGPSLSL